MPRLNVDDSTVILWRFEESIAAQPPVDAAGNVAPLELALADVPAIADGQLGYARVFSATAAFAARPTADLEYVVALPRNITVEALLVYTGNGQQQTIVSHGRDTTAVEQQTWCVQIQELLGTHSIVMRWTRSGGAYSINLIDFTPPTDGKMLLTVTREWVSATEATMTAYVNGVAVGTVTSLVADIEGGTDGELTAGARYTGAAYAEPYVGQIEFIRVSEGARSAEEIEHIYRSLFVYPGWGYDLVKALQPPGKGWARNEDSRVQGLFKSAGAALGAAWAKAAEMLTDFLPDRAWSFLERWETVTRQAPTPGDTIATRRARVVGFLRKVHGYTHDQILEAVADMLGVTTAQMSIAESSNAFTDSFPNAAPADWWTQEAGAGTIAVAAGALTLAAQAGDDVRWSEVTRSPVALRITVANETGASVCAVVNTPTPGADGAAIGIYVHSLVTGDAHLLGIKRDAGSNKWWHATIIGGVFTETLGAAIAAGTTYHLRYVDRGGGLADLDYKIDGTADDFDGPWTTVFDDVATISGRDWAGPFISSTANPLVTGFSGVFDSFRIHAPNALHVYTWFIVRDLAYGGTPDLKGAQLVVDNMEPAHTQGLIVESLEAIVDDPHSLVDREPVT